MKELSSEVREHYVKLEAYYAKKLKEDYDKLKEKYDKKYK